MIYKIKNGYDLKNKEWLQLCAYYVFANSFSLVVEFISQITEKHCLH